MFDPELKYCPKCNDEYMMVAEKCATCNLVLLTGTEMVDFHNTGRGARKGALTKDDDVVTIHKGPLDDLKHLQGLFEQDNIGADIVSQSGDCGKG